ncbi:hypothetical protein EJ08DRAFT_696780 [Tothia fuscella]|uniref:Sas10 C-terminal domain-containing protein n=1 Tax=Tothia fuscella TaxID=1048955 RepID=A0A9P4TY64_9PEZI|nr:hypothetical protein EJ08DRAFT_696780 [Tothia fuscella]
MGKKRKASSDLSKPREPVKQNSKLRIDTYEDVADSEDEFLINRDKIMLDEGPVAKRRRRAVEEDQLLEASDDEILDLPDSAEDDDEDEEMEEDMDMEPSDDESDPESKSKSKSKMFSKRGNGDSDSEASPGPEEDEEELGAWGESKQDYYGADAIDTEQAAKEEEEEAKRLQQKQLQGMSEADFGFDADDWAGDDAAEAGAQEGEGVVMEVLPQNQITEDMGPEEKLRLLKSRYPECELIAQEFVSLQGLLGASEIASRTAKKFLGLQNVLNSQLGRSTIKSHPAIIQHQALSAYLGTMAMYFAVLTSTADVSGSTIAKSPLEMREHPIMNSLVQSRQLWNKVKAIQIPDLEAELATIETELQDRAEKALEMKVIPINGEPNGTIPKSAKKSRKQKPVVDDLGDAQLEARLAQADAEARQAEKMGKLEEDLATLSALTTKTPRTTAKSKAAKPKRFVTNEEDSDFGDETELTAYELAEKAKKKRSLKFYTAQIAQKANKRGTAGKETGGDTDIPHRERLKDRQARLNAEAEKRGKRSKQPGDDLGGESDEDDKRQAKAIRGEANEDGDEYYDMIAHRSKQKKERKAEAAEAYARAAAEGGQVHEVEVVGADGKRKITYQIEKNKGLTPHRKKDVRNPRVKKRKKYEEKKKKLGSIRAVYKGGEGKGGYKGELSGIKTNLVKGVKL